MVNIAHFSIVPCEAAGTISMAANQGGRQLRRALLRQLADVAGLHLEYRNLLGL